MEGRRFREGRNLFGTRGVPFYEPPRDAGPFGEKSGHLRSAEPPVFRFGSGIRDRRKGRRRGKPPRRTVFGPVCARPLPEARMRGRILGGESFGSLGRRFRSRIRRRNGGIFPFRNVSRTLPRTLPDTVSGVRRRRTRRRSFRLPNDALQLRIVRYVKKRGQAPLFSD